MKEIFYTIKFENAVWSHKTEREVLEFVRVAMFKNKDIRKATIEREE